jgi:hypothetical protein
MQQFVEQLPQKAIEKILKIYEKQRIFFTTLIERFRKVIEGTEKKEVCDWWLVYIEHRVDEYLKGKGYRENILPADSYNTPPTDMNAVEENSRCACVCGAFPLWNGVLICFHFPQNPSRCPQGSKGISQICRENVISGV